jgi:hypothetical protein
MGSRRDNTAEGTEMQGQSQGADLDAVAILSRDRLDGYRLPGGENADRRLVARYLYNAAISECLYPLFHVVEVVLRNRIHDAARAAYPIDPVLSNTYNEFPCWLDAVATPVRSEHQSTVEEAKRGVFSELRRRFGAVRANDRSMWTAGRLVAKLPFSFWVFLFDTDYVGPNRQPGPLWPQLFDQVFPYHGGQASLSEVRSRLRRWLVVRNRVMHYERIVPYDTPQGTLQPLTLRRDMLELVRWMSPRAASAVGALDRLPEVFNEPFLRFLRIAAWRH